MSRTQKWIGALVLLGLVLGCGGGQEADPVLTRVGEREIRLSEFQRAFDEAVTRGGAWRPDSSSARRFLDEYIAKTLLEQIATDSLNWTPLLEHRAVSYLESMMIQKMREDVYGHAARFTDEELRRIYEMGRTTYRYRAIPFETQEEARSKLNNIRQGAVFAKVADHLLGQGDGGMVGWKSVIEAPKSIIDALSELEPSEVTGPVETGGAFYLLQLVEKAENPSLPPFEQVKDGLRIQLAQDQGGTLMRRFQRHLLQKYRYQAKMAEVLWVQEFLREETRGIPRQFQPEGQYTTEAPAWTECPMNEEEGNRILATTTVDTIRAILFLDHLMTKPSFTWPLFEETEDVNELLEELVLQRLEAVEAWERHYDQDPDLQWRAQKRRHLILVRQFVIQHIRPLIRPSVAEARDWYDRQLPTYRRDHAFEDVVGEIRGEIAEARVDSVLNVYIPERRAITPVETDEDVFQRVQYRSPVTSG